MASRWVSGIFVPRYCRVRLAPRIVHRLPRRAQLLRTIHFLRDIRHLVGFAADEAEQRRRERPSDFGQVHALQAIAIGAQRRVLLRQQATQFADVALGVDAVSNKRKLTSIFQPIASQ
jgi:hypothetical protein